MDGKTDFGPNYSARDLESDERKAERAVIEAAEAHLPALRIYNNQAAELFGASMENSYTRLEATIEAMQAARRK